MKVKIKDKEIREYQNISTPDFPKYSAPLVNLANRFAQGTRPKVVGQLTEMIQEFTGKSLIEWEKWYLEQKPDAIQNATEKIVPMMKNLKDTIDEIGKQLIEEWVKDLVIVKTFVGLRFQEAILKKGAEIKKTNFRFSKSGEESKGIDGYIGDIPVSIKPHTYKIKAELSENIPFRIIYYKKIRGGVEVDYGE